jgi:hypothetical protein
MGKLEKKRTFETIASNVAEYLHKPDWWYNPFELVRLVWNVGYILVQWCIIALFKPVSNRSALAQYRLKAEGGCSITGRLQSLLGGSRSLALD